MPVVGTNPIYELTVNYDVAGVNGSNVYYYERNTVPATSVAFQELIDGYLDQIVPTWADLTNSRTSITTIECRRLNDLADFGESPIGIPGNVVDDQLPSFVAYAIRLNRATKETRSGAKRYPGVGEADTNPGGSALNAGAIIRLEALATALAVPITEDGETFTQVIVGNKIDRSGPTPVVRPEADWIFNGIQSITVKSRVTSQASRKSL